VRISKLVNLFAVLVAAALVACCQKPEQLQKQTSLPSQPQLSQLKCQVNPSVLFEMPVAKSYVHKNQGEPEILINYRVAKIGEHQAFGFQYACPETVKDNQILFVFASSFVPQFHMNNVFAPLDIAFIDETGKIVNIQQMQVYTDLGAQVLYSPNVKVKYALEAREGYFKELGIQVGDHLTSKRL